MEKCSQVSQRFKQITVSRAACVHVCACVRASVRVATEMIGIQVLLTIGEEAIKRGFCVFNDLK